MDDRVEEVIAALRQVHDPCSLRTSRPMDIVSMGLIGQLHVDGGDVRITLVLTEPACFFAGSIIRAVEQNVDQLPWVRSREVALDECEIWTPDRMVPTGLHVREHQPGGGRQRHAPVNVSPMASPPAVVNVSDRR